MKKRKKRSKCISSLGGINWFLDQSNALDVHLRNSEGVYHKVMPTLFELLDPKLAVIDVGANFGYWTLPLAKHFSACYSLEADLENCGKLMRNLSVNPAFRDRVHPLNAAATNYDGEVKFNIRRSIDGDANLNTGLSSLVIHGPDSDSRSVKAVKIDSLVSSASTRICFLKVDVEGAEFEVLTGGERMIRDNTPYIFWEATLSLDVRFNRENVLHSWELLESLGYKHFRVLESGVIEECCSIDELKSHNLDVDILSVHTSNIEHFFEVVHYS